jgi:hypothetical protein
MMANKIVLELEAAEKLVVADLRIVLLVAQSKIGEFQKKAEADFQIVQRDAQDAANALVSKLKSMSDKAGLDAKTALFDMEKYFFYVKTDVTTDIKDAVKAVVPTIDAEIKKVEAEEKKVAAAVEGEVKTVVAEAEAEIKKIL